MARTPKPTPFAFAMIMTIEEYLGMEHVNNKTIFKDYDKANIQRRKAIKNSRKKQYLESLGSH